MIEKKGRRSLAAASSHAPDILVELRLVSRAAHADAEEHQQEQAQGQPDEVPRGHNLEEQYDDGHSDERESEVHEHEQDLLYWEDAPADLDLLEQRRGVDDARKRCVGGVAHERERDVAHDEEEREVGGVAAKHVREHDRHDDYHE